MPACQIDAGNAPGPPINSKWVKPDFVIWKAKTATLDDHKAILRTELYADSIRTGNRQGSAEPVRERGRGLDGEVFDAPTGDGAVRARWPCGHGTRVDRREGHSAARQVARLGAGRPGDEFDDGRAHHGCRSSLRGKFNIDVEFHVARCNPTLPSCERGP